MLKNIVWLTPEIFISVITVCLLGYGVIYEKKGGEISQLKKITWLSILTLGLASIMVLIQYDIYNIISLGQSLNLDGHPFGGPGGEVNNLDKTIYITQNGLYGIDSTILGIKFIILLSCIGVLGMSWNNYGVNLIRYEYTQLILLSTLGMLLLVSSKDLISVYLSIELISLSLYILASIQRDGQYSTEAGIKYFLLGAVASGILLFGSALMYWLTGTTSFEGLANIIWYSVYMPSNDNTLILLQSAAIFILIALLFKLAAAPFHMWAPDVYEGSPMIVTAFFAIVPKIATLGLLYQLLFGPFASLFLLIKPFVLFSALLSIIVGSLGAINQTKLKRLVAYSAISHMGFMLLGIGTGVINGLLATFIYICIYIITSFNTFAFLLSLNSPTYISQLTGLSRYNPILALTFVFSLFSMAGVPPLAGFFSKYLILLSVINNNLYLIAIITVIFSVIGSFYYLRLIMWMFFTDNSDHLYKTLSDISMSGLATSKGGEYSNKTNISFIYSLILGLSLFILSTFLFFPNILINFIFESLTLSLI
jgi:NADH-quinone oxidoreductase subunit N